MGTAGSQRHRRSARHPGAYADERLRWPLVLAHLRRDHPELYRAWFAELSPGEFQGGELAIAVADPIRATWLRDRSREAFAAAVAAVTGHLVSVVFRCADQTEGIVVEDPVAAALSTALDPDCIFEQFIVGPSNRLAEATCRAIAAAPGEAYNPLFLHGPPGVGRSHLLQATCLKLMRGRTARRVVYVPGRTFRHAWLSALQCGRVAELRDWLQGAAMLAVDDVELLADCEAVQEELFHVFNSLHGRGAQLAFAGDTPPAELPGIAERLTSRFACGLVVRLDAPGPELCQAIVRELARRRDLDLADVVAEHLGRLFSAGPTGLRAVLSYLDQWVAQDRVEIGTDALAETIGGHEAAT